MPIGSIFSKKMSTARRNSVQKFLSKKKGEGSKINVDLGFVDVSRKPIRKIDKFQPTIGNGSRHTLKVADKGEAGTKERRTPAFRNLVVGLQKPPPDSEIDVKSSSTVHQEYENLSPMKLKESLQE